MIYEGTVTYTGIDNNGNDKVFKLTFIIDNAELFGNAEERLYSNMEGHDDCDVVSIKRSKITEIINARTDSEERIFIADLASIFLDERTGEEKYTTYRMALFAVNLDVAMSRLREHIKQGYSDMEITSVRQTRICDVI